MERGDHDSGVDDNPSVDPSTSSVNNLILDYYKKFGRKRDLEQFFSLSTAQSEIRDPAGTFWRKMKSSNDSSDSGEKKSESSAELCRISIRCSIPEPSGLQGGSFEEHHNSDSESPPIVTEEVVSTTARNSDEDSVKSEDVQSQRSNDAALDTSMNKAHSPTSSVTSQRKLEWDSLADVGYANESDRKTSASSLSTLERLALNQQYSHNDSKLNMKMGPPTSHSTPVEEGGSKCKAKKGLTKKTTKIYQKDVDLVELNVPHNSQTNLPQAISVNLSKHICFNVEKDGGVNIDNIKKDISVSPEKNFVTSKLIDEKLDKEIQTSLSLNKDKNNSLLNHPTNNLLNAQRFPVFISLNSLRRKTKKRKLRVAKKRFRNKNKIKIDSENINKSKATEQVSDADSFEYMPGHIYNQNHLKINNSRGTHAGNKSSLESSAGLTTDSSKGSKHSFSKDLEKSIDILKTVLQQNNNDSTIKKKLIKEVVQRLIKSKYRDDESSTDFLSGLSFNSKLIGEVYHTTTSTSDANNTEDKSKLSKPKKSILQTAKFNSNPIASTSQSAPNLTSVSNLEKPVTSNPTKPAYISNTDSDISSKDKHLTDPEMTRMSSEEFYKKYLEALRREQVYKKHLKDKDNFLKQKLGSSETAIAQLVQDDLLTQSKLKSLIKDLTRNNYNDGSGDASKLEGHSFSNTHVDPHIFLNNQRSHSVFTLSSGDTDGQTKNPKLKNVMKSAFHSSSKAGCSNKEHHYCCCPYHADHAKVAFADSSVQVNIECNKPSEKIEAEDKLRRSNKCTKCKKESPRNIAKVVSDSETGDLKYICVCSDEATSEKVTQNFLVYKCSRLVNKSVQLGDSLARSSSTENEQSTKEIYKCCDQRNPKPKIHLKQKVSSIDIPQNSKSSQTNVHLNLMVRRKSSVKSISSQYSDSTNDVHIPGFENGNSKVYVQEAIRSIQTDISINPMLSDPCLSDINIIDDNECVKLVKEQYKEISKSNSVNNTEAQLSEKKSQVSSSNSSTKIISKTSFENMNQTKKSLDYAYIAQLDKEVQSDLGLVDNNKTDDFNDQFTIPIQGTNMTLKVNLGTTESDKKKMNNYSMKSQGIETEKTDVVEHCTSLREDCTKGVQCCNANIFQQMEQDHTEQNISDEGIAKNEDSIPDTKKTCAVNTYVVDNIKHKCNTYPKKDPGDARKPLLRTNTDISRIENFNLRQLDVKNNNKTTKAHEYPNNNQERLTDQPTTSPHQNQSGKCGVCYNKTSLTDPTEEPNNENLPEKCTACSDQKLLLTQPTNLNNTYQTDQCTACPNQKVETDRPTKPNIYQPKKCTACFNQLTMTGQPTKPNQIQPENCSVCSNKRKLHNQPTKSNDQNQPEYCTTCSEKGANSCNQNQSQNYTTPKYNNHSDQVIKDQSKECSTCSNPIHVSHQPNESNKQSVSKKCTTCSNQKHLPDSSTKSNNNQHQSEMYLSCSSKCSKSEPEAGPVKQGELKLKTQSKPSVTESDSNRDSDKNPDPLLDMIENITRRYSKKDIEKSKRKKCFKEIMNVLNYLLDTEESTDDQDKKTSNTESSSTDQNHDEIPEKVETETVCCPTKTFVDKGVQLPTQVKLNKCRKSDSSEIGVSSEFPTTSSDSATCKLLSRIKKECEKYHQRRCKSHNGLKPCETSSTTSVNCEQCKRVHHCYCLRHKCKSHKAKICGEKPKKKCIAYNLILQTSDSVISEEAAPEINRPLKSIIVKVPSKRRQADNVPFKEMAAKLERNLPNCSPRSPCRGHRSRSLPNESEISSAEDFLRKPQTYTVREYLERNRPEFVEQSSRRQDCLKTINETRPKMCPSPYFKMVVVHTPKCVAGSCLDPCNMCYGGMPMPCNQCVDPYTHIQNEVTRIANERNAKRKLLSLQLAKQQTLSALTDEELRRFAKQLSEELRRKKVAPKFINEREMKKHSEKIYKSLPEVTRKKEELKKDNIKKTNLLMANLFKKNLQKKTLRGSVNLSNYSTVIKI